MAKNNGATLTALEPSNDAADAIATLQPYEVDVTIKGTAPLLMHRYNVEHVEEVSRQKKGSKAKKTDAVEAYVYRDDHGVLCVPVAAVVGAICEVAKKHRDPSSPKSSLHKTAKAVVIAATELAPLGVKSWDYEDKRRVCVNHAAVARVRPAMKPGWTVSLRLLVTSSEYVDEQKLHELLVQAGVLVGIGDFRPTFGRFTITSFKKCHLSN